MQIELSPAVRRDGAGARSKGWAFATLVTRWILPRAHSWDLRVWLGHLQHLELRTGSCYLP